MRVLHLVLWIHGLLGLGIWTVSEKKSQQEYREGKQAREVFDSTMKTLFQAPKTFSMAKHQKKKRKPKASASDRVSSAKPKEG